MLTTILIIAVIIVIILIIKKIKKKPYIIRKDFITHFEGGEGSGKTALMVHVGLGEINDRLKQDTIRKFFNKFIPFKKLKLKLPCLEIYSDFPMLYKDGKHEVYTKALNPNVLWWETRVEKGSIMLLDELSFFFPAKKEQEELSKRFKITYLRHALDSDECGNRATIITSSQSMSEVNKTFRQKANNVYVLRHCRKGKLPFSKSRVNILNVIMNEDISNQYIDKIDEINEYKFRFPKNNYVSTYGRELYQLPEQIIQDIVKNYNLLFELMGIKNKRRWKGLIYHIEKSKLANYTMGKSN